MSKFNILRRDERGAAAIEFALAVPVLIMMIYGIFRSGCSTRPTPACSMRWARARATRRFYPTPTDTQIKARMNSKLFGRGYGTFTVADPVTDATNGLQDLTVNYSTPMDFLIVPGPTVTVSRPSGSTCRPSDQRVQPRPVKSGFRFSKKAVIASLTSADSAARRNGRSPA